MFLGLLSSRVDALRSFETESADEKVELDLWDEEVRSLKI